MRIREIMCKPNRMVSADDITAPAKAVFFLSSGLQEGRKYEFTTCYEETKVDTILHLYSGSCESPSCVSANDDGNTFYVQSSLSFKGSF